MALRAKIASIPLPIMISLFLHASAAAGVIVAHAGHARAGTTEVQLLEIDTLPPETVPVETVQQEEPKPEPTKTAGLPIPHDHTHPYPVANHDARPHDPKLEHDHDHDDDHHPPPAPAEAAQPAPVATSDAPLARFTISIGNNTGVATGPRVAGDARGSGNGSAVAPAPQAQAPEVIHPVSGVQVQARLVAGSTAAYPPGARADEVEGDVGLEIVVDGEGRVIDARVARSGGHGFDESALVAIKRYRFSPAQLGGRAVRVRMPWIVQFRLR